MPEVDVFCHFFSLGESGRLFSPPDRLRTMCAPFPTFQHLATCQFYQMFTNIVRSFVLGFIHQSGHSSSFSDIRQTALRYGGSPPVRFWSLLLEPQHHHRGLTPTFQIEMFGVPAKSAPLEAGKTLQPPKHFPREPIFSENTGLGINRPERFRPAFRILARWPRRSRAV